VNEEHVEFKNSKNAFKSSGGQKGVVDFELSIFKVLMIFV